MPTFGSLFSGAGGMDLGFEYAGFTPLWRVENNPNCIQVLQRYKPDVSIYNNIIGLDTSGLTRPDVIIGGFPCTDLSICRFGSHQHFEGKDSGLIYEMSRVIEEIKPEYFVIENVPKLYNLWTTVESLGLFSSYQTTRKVLSASDFNARTRRKRCFVIGGLGRKPASKILDFFTGYKPPFETRRPADVFPMCLPWKGGVSLERLGACLIVNPPN